MKTYQDYEKAQDKLEFIKAAINEYRASDEYKTALIADEYEKQRNVTIREAVRYFYTMDGRTVVDFTAANNKLANNFFHRLNSQRRSYLLGNGTSFTRTEKRMIDGRERTVDLTKEALGTDFDNKLYEAAYFALIHGVSYTRCDEKKYYVFPATQFCPLYDEYTNTTIHHTGNCLQILAKQHTTGHLCQMIVLIMKLPDYYTIAVSVWK